MSEIVGGAAAPAVSTPAESGAQVDNSANQVAGQAGAENAQATPIDAIQDAVDNGEISQAEAAKLIKKFELKVRGKTVEREIDLGDEEAVKNILQLAEVSKLSMQERAELEKRFEQILLSGKGDPGRFMKEAFGIDPDDWAAAHIERKIEHLKKSPEMLEKERIQAELQAAREESKKLKEEKENAEMSKLQQEALTSLQSEISGAIKTHTKLPDTRFVQKKMADAILWAENNGFPGATADDVAPLVEQEMRDELNALYDLMPEDVLENYVGRKNIERLRKSKIAKAKEVPSANSVKQTASIKVEEKKPSQPIDAKKFWRGR